MYDASKFNPKNPKFVIYILEELKGYDNLTSIKDDNLCVECQY